MKFDPRQNDWSAKLIYAIISALFLLILILTLGNHKMVELNFFQEEQLTSLSLIIIGAFVVGFITAMLLKIQVLKFQERIREYAEGDRQASR